jgi:5-methylcytosine-specific restriction protein A
MMMPPHRCASCRQLVTGSCPTCSRAIDTRRGTAHARGYSYRWSLYSKRWLAHRPLCGQQQNGVLSGAFGSQCAATDRVQRARCVDHIQPAALCPDRFWDPSNHQSLCGPCNRRKGQHTSGGGL